MSSHIAAECFHGTISCDEAEARLRANDRDKSYLTRRCEAKAGTFVLSYIVDNIPHHSLIPTLTTKKKGVVKYEDLYDVVEEFITSSKYCENVVLLAPASTSADRDDDQPCAAGGEKERDDCHLHQGDSDGATTAAVYAEVYFNLLCSMEPSSLKLTGTQELDDRIYSEFKQSFPILCLDCIILYFKFFQD